MPQELTKSLKFRHIMMISIGGTIGTGLFVGIASPLHTAGFLGTPIAYTIAGVVMLLTMLSLGELSSAIPHTGSFQHYMSIFFENQYWSYIVGWLYWLSWVLTISADLTATSMTLHDLYPGISTMVYVLAVLVFLGAVHMYTVAAYGESESFFATIKVLTILCFVLSCLYLIFFNGDGRPINNILSPSVGLPHGVVGVLACMTTVIYAFQGIEMVATLAGETKNPQGVMVKIIKMLVVRVFLFYFLTVFLLVLVYPVGYHAAISPFVWIFSHIGIPHADVVMKLIIVLCGLSASSSALYASSRLLWSMANHKMAPQFFNTTTERGSPQYAILFTVVISSVALLSHYIAPQHFYIYLISSTGQVGCLAWFCISLCQYKFRRGKARGLYSEYPLKYRTPLFPWVPLLAMALNLISIVGLWLSDDGKLIFVSELVIVVVLSLSYLLVKDTLAKEKALKDEAIKAPVKSLSV